MPIRNSSNRNRPSAPATGARAADATRPRTPANPAANARNAPPATPADNRAPIDAATLGNLASGDTPPPNAAPNPVMARIGTLNGDVGGIASLRSDNIRADAAAIDTCLKTPNAWSVLRKYTTEKDLHDVKNMCMQVNPQKWEEIYVQFFDAVQQAQAARPVELRNRDQKLPENWFHEPFYYTYVQYFGTESRDTKATFDDLIKQLDYLEEAGVKNLFLLPHYESPMGDGGYDVSDFKPRQDLGGKEAYDRFMKEANSRGFRICTDLPMNHTSVQHKWFQKALDGDEDKLNYYLRRDGREKIGVEDRNGDLFAIYKDPDGTITERVLIFPDVDQEHGERFKLKDGREVNIYQEFYPFQLDLDLTNPGLLKEVFQLLGDELNQGVMGKRTDAIAHWIKKPGTTADGLDETHALHALLKSFSRHVSPKMIILPEAVRGMNELKTYTGVETEIAGKKTASEGDALFNFQMQGALREMTYFQTTKPFWEMAFQVPDLPANAQMLNLLEHHDETYLGMISDHNRPYLGDHIEKNHGMVYKNGMSAGGRYADNLDNNPERIATAIFSLYMAPGTPVMYYGTEIGARSRPEHAKRAQENQHKIFQELGIDVPFDKAFDPRELQRGSISAQEFQDAKQEKPFQTFAALNRLRSERPSLQSNYLTPIDNGHDCVLSLVKFTPDQSDTPVMGLANLSGEKRTLNLPLDQVREKLGVPAGKSFELQDLLNDNRRLPMKIAGGQVLIELAPFQSVLLDRDVF